MSPRSVRCPRPVARAADRLAAAVPTGCRSRRCVWTHDFAPACNTAKRDVASRIVVGVPNETATTTGERRLGTSVLLVNEPTHRACLRSVGRVDMDEGNSGKSRLVCQELSELMKRPSVHCGPLGLAEPYPIADAGELLHRDAATGALSHGHNAFRDNVIDIRYKEGLLSSASPEQASSRGCSFLLQALAEARLPATVGDEQSPTVPVAVAGGGDVDDPQVYAKEAGRRRQWSFRTINTGEQKPFATTQHKIGLADLVGAYQSHLTRAAGDPQTFDSAGCRPNRDRRGISSVGDLPGQAPRVEWLRADFPPPVLTGTAARIGISNFSDDTDGRLGRQAKSRSDLRVEPPVSVVFSEDLALEHAGGQPIGCGITGMQGRRQCNGLALRRQQPDLDRQLHTVHSRTRVRSMQVHDRVIGMFGYRRLRSDRTFWVLAGPPGGAGFCWQEA